MNKRYLFTITYDGGGYCGWQVQKNAVSVQETVQNALGRIFGIRPDVTGCSRTDAGVHADMFCFHCDLAWPGQPEALRKALDANLPFDIAVKDAVEVPENFHARYSAKAKCYRYVIDNGKYRDPFRLKHAWYQPASLNEEAMRYASEMICGRHDFSAFCSSGSSVVDKVRTVHSLSLTRNGNIIEMFVEADGFLYNMVRIIAGTLVMVGKEQLTQENILYAFECGDRGLLGPTAPAYALFLNKVIY